MVDQLDNIIGQPHAVNQLKSLVRNNRIPHALIFSGQSGVGKFFSAIQFIKTINQVKDYSKIEQLEEPLVKLIIPLPRGKNEVNESSGTEKLTDKQLDDLKKEILKKQKNLFYKIQLEGANNIKISSIREVRKFLSIEYSDIKYRAIIIEDAHLMNKESQNALLKSLEEPPQGVIFILLTSNEDWLLSTILSRCWKVQFKSLSFDIISEILESKFKVVKESALKAALFSEGSITQGLNLVENEMISLIDSTIKFMRYSLGGWYNSAYNELKIATDDFTRSKVFEVMKLVNIWLTDTRRNKLDYQFYYFQDYPDTLEKFNKSFPNAKIDELIQEIDELIASMDNNILLNVIILNLILKLNFILTRK